MSRRLELEGQKFGRLTVLGFHDVDPKRKESRWLCKCECGNKRIVRGWKLTSGHTKSCGCLNKERAIAASTTHGLSSEKLYSIWKAMLARCENKKHPAYKDYGGRGIKVCDEWHDIRTFIKWANNNGYKEGLELDRIDNNGNYEPSNCRFTTRKKQTRNTRRNINVTIDGQTKTLSEWAEIHNLKVNTLQYRYYRGDRGRRLVRPVETKYRHGQAGGDARC
ncbi:hypothetical protein SAMN05660923_03051 [Tepidimicrobium xylanilyticum]|uniref:AP2 domain-containing protein n=1 Tax=Tepidimicrobium xylanilyticum TaxID=1123352 RepID=A0A1H3F389_9FIRM|nr:hypothetical protein SAMN05660923_03051 [Tepidimicrobium xylanilyticum]